MVRIRIYDHHLKAFENFSTHETNAKVTCASRGIMSGSGTNILHHLLPFLQGRHSGAGSLQRELPYSGAPSASIARGLTTTSFLIWLLATLFLVVLAMNT